MQKVVEGVLANYEEFGVSGGEWLVILHGWGGNEREWRQVGLELGKRYRVVVPDLPGFGKTELVRDDWGIYQYAEWVKNFLAKMGIRECVVIGHSFGGRVGIILAAKEPGLVTRLILVDAAGMEKERLVTRLLRLAKPVVGSLPQGVKDLLGSRDYKQAGRLRKILVQVVNEDLTALLGTIKCLTLVVWGDRDGVLPVVIGKRMREAIQGARLRLVWGAGHWPHATNQEDFLRILEEEGI
jgi:pimeloyl-ACP methyl ester carboxylesterase